MTGWEERSKHPVEENVVMTICGSFHLTSLILLSWNKIFDGTTGYFTALWGQFPFCVAWTKSHNGVAFTAFINGMKYCMFGIHSELRDT